MKCVCEPSLQLTSAWSLQSMCTLHPKNRESWDVMRCRYIFSSWANMFLLLECCLSERSLYSVPLPDLSDQSEAPLRPAREDVAFSRCPWRQRHTDRGRGRQVWHTVTVAVALRSKNYMQSKKVSKVILFRIISFRLLCVLCYIILLYYHLYINIVALF